MLRCRAWLLLTVCLHCASICGGELELLYPSSAKPRSRQLLCTSGDNLRGDFVIQIIHLPLRHQRHQRPLEPALGQLHYFDDPRYCASSSSRNHFQL